jgi:hypothetical protein
MRREDFISEYMQVRQAAMKPSTIISAFKKSGIWPVDRTVFGDDDYAPSIPYSTEVPNVPSLPEDPLRPNNSNSDLESDSESDSDDDTEPRPAASRDAVHSLGDMDLDLPQTTPTIPPELSHTVASSSTSSQPESHSVSQPTPRSLSPSLSAVGNTAFPAPVVGSGRSESQPIIPMQFYHDPVLFDRINRLETQVQRLTGHVKMVELELQNEKRKANQRDGRASKRRKLNVEARVLTSAEGKRLAAEKDAERAAKMQKRKEAETLRKEKEAEREELRRIRGPDAPFIGSLSSKSKPELREIAAALGLSEDGTKDALTQRITACFDLDPLLRDRPRFTGLFHRATRRRPQATNENAHPMASIPSVPVPKSPHNVSMRNPLATDIVNHPGASPLPGPSTFYYNLIPTQVDNMATFNFPAGPSSASNMPLPWQYGQPGPGYPHT